MRLFKTSRSKSSPARSPGSLFPASDPVGDDDGDDDGGEILDIAIARLLAVDQGDTVEVRLKDVKKEVANLAEAAARFRQRSRQVLDRERKRRVAAERSLNRHTWRPVVLSLDSPAKGSLSPAVSEGSVSIAQVAVGGWEDAEEEASLLREELKGMSEEFVTQENKTESLRAALEDLMQEEAKSECLRSELQNLINQEARAEELRAEAAKMDAAALKEWQDKAVRLQTELSAVKNELRTTQEEYHSLSVEHQKLCDRLQAQRLGDQQARQLEYLQVYLLEQVRAHQISCRALYRCKSTPH
jgi:hypothetical protein